MVNRVPAVVLGIRPWTSARDGDRQLGRKLADLQQRLATAVRDERSEIDRLRTAAPDALVIEVPLAIDEPSSLSRLVTLSSALS